MNGPTSGVDSKTLYLDLDPEICTNLDPDQSLFLHSCVTGMVLIFIIKMNYLIKHFIL